MIIGPGQGIDLGKERCKIGAVSLRQFKVQCSRVQSELPLCCVETEPLRTNRCRAQIVIFYPATFGTSLTQAGTSSNRSSRSTASLRLSR